MTDKIIELLMEGGYDLLINNFRTFSGLLHPQAKDSVEIILQKRLPGLQKRGGAAFAKASIPWNYLKDLKMLEDVLFKELKPKVDRTLVIEKAKRKL
jgi:hypothetical protein